jgi:hypothetical protein
MNQNHPPSWESFETCWLKYSSLSPAQSSTTFTALPPHNCMWEPTTSTSQSVRTTAAPTPIGLGTTSNGGRPCSPAGRLWAGHRVVTACGGLPNESRWPLGDSLLLCALQMSCLEVRVAPTVWLAQRDPHFYLLLLAVSGPMGTGAAMVCADWLVFLVGSHMYKHGCVQDIKGMHNKYKNLHAGICTGVGMF